MINSNLGPISCTVSEIRRFIGRKIAKIPVSIHTQSHKSPSLGVISIEFRDEADVSRNQNVMFALSDGEEIMTLASFVLTQYRSVTDGRTDRQTDGHSFSGYSWARPRGVQLLAGYTSISRCALFKRRLFWYHLCAIPLSATPRRMRRLDPPSAPRCVLRGQTDTTYHGQTRLASHSCRTQLKAGNTSACIALVKTFGNTEQLIILSSA